MPAKKKPQILEPETGRTASSFALQTVSVDTDGMRALQDRLVDTYGAIRTLAERLRQTREAFGVSRSKLTEVSDVSEGRLSSIESFNSDPTPAEATRIMRALVKFAEDANGKQLQLGDKTDPT